MVGNTIKTVYVCLHDAPTFGATPIIKMEITKHGYISHKQLINLRHNLEAYIDEQVRTLNPDNNGAWPQ